MLHLVTNPESEFHQLAREQQIEQLQAENDALREQVQKLVPSRNDGGGSSVGAGGGSTGVAVAVKDAEIAVLQRKVSELEKAMRRLKDVFKDRITAFREACRYLFGYR